MNLNSRIKQTTDEAPQRQFLEEKKFLVPPKSDKENTSDVESEGSTFKEYSEYSAYKHQTKTSLYPETKSTLHPDEHERSNSRNYR